MRSTHARHQLLLVHRAASLPALVARSQTALLCRSLSLTSPHHPSKLRAWVDRHRQQQEEQAAALTLPNNDPPMRPCAALTQAGEKVRLFHLESPEPNESPHETCFLLCEQVPTHHPESSRVMPLLYKVRTQSSAPSFPLEDYRDMSRKIGAQINSVNPTSACRHGHRKSCLTCSRLKSPITDGTRLRAHGSTDATHGMRNLVHHWTTAEWLAKKQHGAASSSSNVKAARHAVILFCRVGPHDVV